MAEHTGIQWTDATWNPWHGCIKVSPGCKNCYMYTEKKMYGQEPSIVSRSKTKFLEPLKWTPEWLAKQAAKNGTDWRVGDPFRVFTCSWSDFFIEDADEWRPEAWDVIRRTPHLTYQVLTKRPERVAGLLPADWGEGYPNVWLGVSVESPAYTWRINRLLEIPAATRFLSIEPLLQGLSLRAWPPFFADAVNAVAAVFEVEPSLLCVDRRAIDWVIVGGESGPGARPCNLQWVRRIVAECQAALVPVYVKQLGRLPVDGPDEFDVELSDPKGGDIEEFPEELRVRQFPNTQQKVAA